MLIDRRAHKRFIVNGQASFELPSGKFQAEVVSISAGGLLLITEAKPVMEERLQVQFVLEGFAGQHQGEGRVTRLEPGVVGVEFVSKPEALQEMLDWLESRFVAGLI